MVSSAHGAFGRRHGAGMGRPEGAEIFYISREKQVMITPFKGGNIGTPRVLFRAQHLVDPEGSGLFFRSHPYAATSDGQRFLLAVTAEDPDAPPISVILNWQALMKR